MIGSGLSPDPGDRVTALAVGRYYTLSSGNGFTGHIHEIVIMDSDTLDNNVADLLSYAAQKWTP